MSQSSDNWMLFGYDVRDFGRLWRVAWMDFLWADDSPVKNQLDDIVSVQRGSESGAYQAGRRVEHGQVALRAVALPEDLVLVRKLSLPPAALPNLESVVDLEVNASSPFSTDDTTAGSVLLPGGTEKLELRIVIASRSAVMSYLSREHEVHEATEREVWAEVDGHWVVLRGFGEGRRRTSYRQRLQRAGGMLAAAAFLSLLIVAVNVGFKRLELNQLENLAAHTQREAATAMELRGQLTNVNETISEVNRLVAAYPSPHAELERLTRLLGDDAFIQQFQMTGREIRLRGQATDAAGIMQLLTEQDAYSSVTAPQAISKISSSTKEQFYLNITLALEDRG